jgi:multidrug efflux pump subunit AcrA (membrane-fusion protein)
VVADLLVAPGTQVNAGDVLAVVQPREQATSDTDPNGAEA